MSIDLAYDIYPRNAPRNGTILTRLVAGDFLLGTEPRKVLRGVGSGKIVIHRSHPAVEAGYLAHGNYVRVRKLTDESVVHGFFLNDGNERVLSVDEKGREIREYGGMGTLSYLARATFGKTLRSDADESLAEHQEFVDANGYLRFSGPETYGGVLGRLIYEARLDDPDAVPELQAHEWDDVEDSGGTAWTEFDDYYDVRVGDNLLDLAIDLMRKGIDLFLDPHTFVPRAYLAGTYGTDRTSGTFAAGKVRFVAGVNIAADVERALPMVPSATHVTVIGQDGVTQLTVADPDWSDGEAVYKDTIRLDTTVDPTIMEEAGAESIRLRKLHSDAVMLPHIWGDDEAAGLYLPTEHYDVGDLVTLHTGDEANDFTEESIQVAAIRWRMRPAGDFEPVAELGAQYIDQRSAAQINSLTTVIRSGTHVHPPNPRLCPSAIDILAGLTDASLKASGATAVSGLKRFAVDGDPETRWSPPFGSSGPTAEHWWAADVGSPREASAFRYYVSPAGPGYDLASAGIVYGSNDPDAWAWLVDDDGHLTTDPADNGWVEAVSWTDQTSGDTGLRNFDSVSYRYWLIRATDGGTGTDDEFDANAFELWANPRHGHSVEASRCDHGHSAEQIDEQHYGTVQNAITVLRSRSGPGWFDIRAGYGAVGDLAALDTDAIGEAIEDMNAAGGGVLYIPGAGGYLYDAALPAITVPCKVLGDGAGAFPYGVGIGSRLVATSANIGGFTFSDAGWVAEDFALVTDAGSTPSAGAGIASADPLYARMRGIIVAGFYDNIDMSDSQRWSLADSFITSPVRYGLRIRGTDDGDQSISGCYFMADEHNATAAIRQEGAGGLKISTTKINARGVAPFGRFVDGLSVDVSTIPASTSVLEVGRTSIENISGDAIDIRTTGDGRLYGIDLQFQAGLFDNDTGRALRITAAAAGGPADEGSISQVIASGNWRTDGTPREAVELTNVQGITFGAIELLGFDDLYTQSGSTDITVLGGGGAVAAADVTIADAGGYYTGTDVEAALQEVGAALDAVPTLVYLPLTTVIGGVPELVWDADHSLIPTGSTP